MPRADPALHTAAACAILDSARRPIDPSETAIDRLHAAQAGAVAALLCPDCRAAGGPSCSYCVALSGGCVDFEAGLDAVVIDLPRVLRQPSYARGAAVARMRKKLTYRAAAEQIDREYGIGMQQRRTRYGAPVAQYQLLWGQADNPATVCYVTVKVGATPEEIIELARHIAETREVER